MDFLLYGFGPYKQFRSNITSKIVRKVPRSANLKTIVFPVRFNKTQFTAAIRKNNPDIILGLGQCSTGTKLRIERRAVNRRRNNKEDKGRAIVRGGAKFLPTTLKLRSLGRGAQPSLSAGDYVCNYSMYVMLDYIKRRGKKVRYGFIHIPHNYPRVRAEQLIRLAARRLAPARPPARARRVISPIESAARSRPRSRPTRR
jgi:pyroglutamyl-peptidase